MRDHNVRAQVLGVWQTDRGRGAARGDTVSLFEKRTCKTCGMKFQCTGPRGYMSANEVRARFGVAPTSYDQVLSVLKAESDRVIREGWK